MPGLMAGALVGATLLFAMRFHGISRLSLHRQSLPLTRSQAPAEYRLVEEYCRRLELYPPSMRVIESPGLNVGIYGFTAQDTQLVFTRGALQTLNRSQLAALIARALTHASTGEVANQTWLARLFDFLHTVLDSGRRRRNGRSEPLALRRVFQQVLLYPLTLFPAFVLRSARNDAEADARSIQVTQNPRALAEAFRRLEASSERVPYRAPFSARHLFLSAPPSADPLTRIFFSGSGFGKRIRVVETLGMVPTK